MNHTYTCSCCGEDFSGGYMIGVDFFCKRCAFEKLEDEMGVREVC